MISVIRTLTPFSYPSMYMCLYIFFRLKSRPLENEKGMLCRIERVGVLVR